MQTVGLLFMIGGLLILLSVIVYIFTERYHEDITSKELWDIHDDPLF